MRSLHPADAVHKGFGTIPTSILQRKNGVCIYERPACDIDVSLQLCEDIVCAHAACQQLFQHVLCFGFLCRFRCFGFSFDLFSLDSGDFLVDRFQLSFLGFQVSFQCIDISGNRCDFSGSGFLCSLLFSELCSKVNGCFYGLGLVFASLRL